MPALQGPHRSLVALAFLSAIDAHAQGSSLRSGPPAWAADAIYYVVTPDRFRNGDPRNDPKPGDLRGAPPFDAPREWRVSPWTADFFKLQPWEKATGRAFHEVAPLRRFGGDLQGILERLEYIQSTGATVLLIEPLFEAPSAGRRDPAALHHVDNNLGPDPDGDRLIWATENPADPSTWKWSGADRLLLRLIQECHRRQMKIVLDAVFDHVGATFWAFRDVRVRGRASRYADWFAIRTFDDPKTPADELDYAAAEGVREWPELRREGDSLAAGPRDHLRAIVRRWGDPNGDGDPSDGVDGWRIGAVDRLPRGFVRELRRAVLTVNPEALLAGQPSSDALAVSTGKGRGPSIRSDELDAATNDAWARAAKGFLIDQKAGLGAAAFDAQSAALRAEIPAENALALLNDLDREGGARIASQIVNPDRPEDPETAPKADPRFEVRAPRGEELRKLRLLLLFQFASVGAPVLRYGGEAGMWGLAEPDLEKPMLFRDLAYEPEAAHPFGQARRADPVRFDEELFKFVQGLARIRAATSALRRGSTETVLADDARRVLAFARVDEAGRVVAAFNASDKEATVELPAPAAAVRDLLSGRRLRARDEKVLLAIPASSAVYLAADAR